MEAGTKLKCINRSGVLNLTLGKVYTTISNLTLGGVHTTTSEGSGMLFIINDAGIKCAYAIERFVVVKEDNEVSEEITLKLTPIEANTLLGLMTLTEGDREFSLRKHILSISQKLSDRFVTNHEDLMEFTTHLQDDTIQIEFRHFNAVNEIKSVEKQIDNLKHKLEQLKGE